MFHQDVCAQNSESFEVTGNHMVVEQCCESIPCRDCQAVEVPFSQCRKCEYWDNCEPWDGANYIGPECTE